MKKIFKLFAIVFALLLIVSPLKSVNASPVRVVDNADLLQQDEANELISLIDTVSQKHNVDVVLVTVNSTNGKTLEAFADDFYDYNGYGMGSERSGILMLVDMDSRTIWFSTRGYCTYAFTDYGIYQLEDTVIDEIIDKGYFKGFVKYVNEAERYLSLADSGNPIDIIPEPEPEKEEFTPNPFISAGLGGLVALISSLSAKGKNKSVSKKYTASDYKRAGSFHMTNANQWFLYKTVSRSRIVRDDDRGHSSGGGSTTHISSSGATHGGGGGRRKF